MADRKISDLTALTTPATGDLLPIVDVSEAAAADKNKSITIQELFKGVPDGTAAAPGLAFESDDGNGIYKPGTDQVAISTGGTGRLFVDASGRVGVGTSSPSNALVVSNSGANGIEFGPVNGDIFTYNRSTLAYTNMLISCNEFVVRTNGSNERLRIDSSGRLLVGTSTARSNFYNTTASAGIQLEGSSTSRRLSIISDENQSSGPATIILGLQKSGSVGGNTIVGSGDMLGDVAFMGNDGAEFVQAASIRGEVDGTPGANDMPGRLVFHTTADGASSPTERMRIDSSGRVGIGTSSVGRKLDIYSPAEADGGVRIQNGGGHPDLELVGNQGNIYARFSELGATDPGSLKLFNNGSVTTCLAANGASYFTGGSLGVGTTSPSDKLHVSGVIRAARTTDASQYGTISIETGNVVINAEGGINTTFQNGGSEKVRIDSSGRVGIGTSSPSYLLDVKQNIATPVCHIETNSTGNNVLLSLDGASGFASGGAARMRFGRATQGANSVEAGYDHDSTGFQITKNGSALLTANSTGVGIGTANPSSILTCESSSDLSIKVTKSGIASLRLGFDTNGAYVEGVGGGQHLGFRAGNSERARIDSSGRLLVGTSSARTNFFNTTLGAALQVEGTDYNTSTVSCVINSTSSDPIITLARSRGTSVGSNTIVSSGDTLGRLIFQGNDGTEFVQAASIACDSDGTPGTNDMPGRLVFSTTADGASSPTERMRITSKGYAKFSNSGSYRLVNSSEHEFSQHEASNWTLRVANHHASTPYGIVIDYNNSSPNTNDYYFIYATDNTALRFRVNSNGGIENYQSNDANLCDEREKKNIETLDSTWGCLKNWDLKKFHYNEDADTDDKRYGVIAQQVAPHCPEVITDWVKQKAEDAVLDDDGNVVTPAKEEIVRMGVKEQQMMWMAIKALQEAQTRIETLEAKVAALEAN